MATLKKVLKSDVRMRNSMPRKAKKGDTITSVKGAITPVPNGPLVKKRGVYAGSTLKNGGKTPARKLKKAQTGSKVDNTRVKKPIVRPSSQRVEAQEKLKIAKKLYKDNPSSSKVFSDAVDSAKSRLSRAPKQRYGGSVKKKNEW